jgi:hypothetical protein
MVGRQKRSLHLERETWRLEARTTMIILLVLVLFGLLSWLCVAQASKVSSVRYRIWKKQAQQARLQRENAELLGGIMEMVNVSRLENLALGLGYVPAERVRYLDVPGYSTARTELRRSDGVSRGEVAIVPRLEENAPVLQEEPKGESVGVSRLWDKVISQFKDWVGK